MLVVDGITLVLFCQWDSGRQPRLRHIRKNQEKKNLPSAALNGVTVGRQVIDIFLLPKKGTHGLHNSNSKLLENRAWARNSLTTTCSSDADSSSESEGEFTFTIKTNSPLSSAMTLVLNRKGSCRRSGGPRSGPGEWKGEREGKGEGREGQAGGWGGWAGRERRAHGERCFAEAADNSHTRAQACRMA